MKGENGEKLFSLRRNGKGRQKHTLTHTQRGGSKLSLSRKTDDCNFNSVSATENKRVVQHKSYNFVNVFPYPESKCVCMSRSVFMLESICLHAFLCALKAAM